MPEMSDVITHDIRVGATAYYLPDESDPDAHVYFFGYRIVIVNQSPRTVQLLTRHWDIIDGDGQCRTVDGPGVVGEQPLLVPDQGFKYTSFAKLPTTWGTMDGYYTMRNDRDETFDVTIGRFWLTMIAHDQSQSLNANTDTETDIKADASPDDHPPLD